MHAHVDLKAGKPWQLMYHGHSVTGVHEHPELGLGPMGEDPWPDSLYPWGPILPKGYREEGP